MTGTRIAIFGHLPPLPIVIDEPYHYDEIAFGLLFLFTIDLDIYMSLSLCFHRHPSVDGGKKRGEITSSFILFVVYSWKFATTEQCRTAADGEKGVTQLLAASRWYTYIYIDWNRFLSRSMIGETSRSWHIETDKRKWYRNATWLALIGHAVTEFFLFPPRLPSTDKKKIPSTPCKPN